MSSIEIIIVDVVSLVKRIGKLDGEVPTDKDIYADLGVESLNSIEILVALEEQFGLVIDDTKFIKARTIQGLAELVHGSKAA